MALLCTVMYKPGDSQQTAARARVAAGLSEVLQQWLRGVTKVEVVTRLAEFAPDAREAQSIEIVLTPEFGAAEFVEEALSRASMGRFAECVRLVWEYISGQKELYAPAGWCTLLMRFWGREGEAGALIVIPKGLVSACTAFSGLNPRTYLTGSTE